MDTSKQIYLESKKHLSTGNKFWMYKIDFLKKISNISVFTFISVSIEQISFNILSQKNPNNLLFRHVYKLNSFGENSIKAFVSYIKKIVSGLEFDKSIGVFVSKISNSSKSLFFDVFGLDYVSKGKCNYCPEQTITKLSCSHFCCTNCFEENLTNNKFIMCCDKKSSYLTNNFQYYPMNNDFEYIQIKKWFALNNFFSYMDYMAINFGNQTNNSNILDELDESDNDESDINSTVFDGIIYENDPDPDDDDTIYTDDDDNNDDENI